MEIFCDSISGFLDVTSSGGDGEKGQDGGNGGQGKDNVDDVRGVITNVFYDFYLHLKMTLKITNYRHITFYTPYIN